MNIALHTRLTRACFCALGFLAAAAHADYIDYTVVLLRHWHSEYGSSGGNCWETGSEEYSGISKFMLNNDGTWLGGTCYTIDNNGDATKTINETIASKALQSSSSVLDVNFEAWEDDSGSRSSYDSGDDCHTSGTVVDDLTIANSSYRNITQEYGGYGSDDHKTYFSIWWNWSLPAAPTAASATSVGASGFTANWSGPSGYRVTNYKLTVATDSSFANIISGYNGLDVGTATAQAVSSLSAGTTYYYRLTAANETGTGSVSGTASITTLPTAPGVLSATGISATGFTACWSAATGATAYALDVATDSAFSAFVTGYNNVNCGSATSLAVSGLASGTTYYYRVRAANASGTGASSGTQSALTLPAAPTVLAPANVMTASFTARWSETTGAASYLLDVAPDPDFSALVSGYAAKNVGTATSESVAGLSTASTYYYRVNAVNASGTSAASAARTVILFCEPPTGLAASDAAVADRINVLWNSSTGAEGYRLYRATLNDLASAAQIYEGTATLLADTSALAHTTYYYWVCATNQAGNSGFSDSNCGSRKNATPNGLSLSNATLNENAGANATVGQLSATDNDDTTFTFSLVSGTGSTDNGLFNISNNTLCATASLDYESQATRSVRIRVADPYSATYEKVFAIAVLDVTEAPVIAEGDTVSATMNEDGTWTPPILIASGGTGTLTWSLLTAPAQGSASVAGTGSSPTLAYTPAADWSGIASFVAQVTDGQGLSDSATVTVTVLPVNDAPTLDTIANQTAAFNASVGPLPLTVGDIDSDAETLVLTGSSDNAALLADVGIVFGGSGTNRTVTLAPMTNRAGVAAVTVALSDGTLSAQRQFTLTVEKGTQTITFDAPVAHTYGDAPFALAATTDSGLSVTYMVLSGPAAVDGNTVTITGAGAASLRASQAGDANYQPASDVDQSFVVAPKALAVNAEAKTKTYGAADPALTYTADGLVAGDSLAGTLTRDAGEAVGAYAIAQGTLDAGTNYAVAFTGADFTVTKATLVCRPLDTVRFRDTPNPAFNLAINGFVNGDSLADIDARPAAVCAADADSPCGTYPITCEGGSDDSYEFRFEAGTLSVQSRATALLIR